MQKEVFPIAKQYLEESLERQDKLIFQTNERVLQSAQIYSDLSENRTDTLDKIRQKSGIRRRRYEPADKSSVQNFVALDDGPRLYADGRV